MQILVRKADGFVLNSHIFNNPIDYNNQINNGIDLEVYSQEYFDIYDTNITPDTDENVEGFIKLYFYIDGKLVCKYSATSEIDEIIENYERKLASTDYIIIKAYESNLLSKSLDPQYDYDKIAVDRQNLRDKINSLRQLKMDNPTIVTYKPEYMKPTEQYDKE